MLVCTDEVPLDRHAPSSDVLERFPKMVTAIARVWYKS